MVTPGTFLTRPLSFSPLDITRHNYLPGPPRPGPTSQTPQQVIYGGKITRYAPDGSVGRVVEIPTPRVTCCTFGGANLDILYVTTASFRMDRDELTADPLAGKTFAVETGVTGIAEPVFGG